MKSVHASTGLGVLFLSIWLPACGGAVGSGMAVGRVGQHLSSRAGSVPQGAEVCSLKEALAAQPGVDKPISDACSKAAKSDQLWRRSMVVLGAHGDTLESIAAGNNNDHAGQVEAALTGVKGSSWIDVEDGPEKAAREAVAQLVDQMAQNTAKGDLTKAVKDAAPHVKTICDGLIPYLDTQAKGFEDVGKEIEKKRVARTERRCTTIDGKPFCVSYSSIDRVVYANAYGQLVALEAGHAEARDAAAAFCAMHKKLAEAAESGKLSDDATYTEIVEAVKSAQAAPAAPPPADAKAPPAGDAKAPPKK